jgi:hypothetical protein
METAFVSLIAYSVYSLTARLALGFMLAMYDGAKTLSSAQIQAYGAAYIVASPLTIAVLWIAIRMARRDFAEYLALNWPSSGELLRALAIAAILLLAETVAVSIVGAEEISPNPPARSALAYVDEFVVRGFMFRDGRSPSLVQSAPSW